jgi:(1->4)-alpha-D-glucan 1-alpha-D-glucosylmutase
LFLGDFLPFQDTIARYGMYNALSQLVLKIAAPGIPDFYQGTELWDFSLVDPDNRRPIDYAHRQQLLTQLESDEREAPEDFFHTLLRHYTDGRIKLFITQALLNFRRQHHALFQDGDYHPLETLGEKRHHLCAFQRTWKETTILVVVPRLLHHVIPNPEELALGESVWCDTMIKLSDHAPESRYRNVLTKETISTITIDQQHVLSVANIFHHLPVALMESIP